MSRTSKPIALMRLLFAMSGAAFVLWVFLTSSEIIDAPLMDFFTQDFLQDTGADNAVAAIYLNYRVFDTLFEALMLMVSVMEVINVSWSNVHREKYRFEKDDFNRKNNSEIVIRMLGIVYPFLLMIGLYIILNGHNSPGGGFQGGAVLATALISRYLVYPNFDLDLVVLERLEKFFFICILLVPIFYVFMGLQPANTELSHQIYMVVMNTLIGFKVFSGLSVIFYRFVFYEGL